MTWALFFFGLFLAAATPAVAPQTPDNKYRPLGVITIVSVGLLLMVIATLLHQIGGAA